MRRDTAIHAWAEDQTFLVEDIWQRIEVLEHLLEHPEASDMEPPFIIGKIVAFKEVLSVMGLSRKKRPA